MEEKKLTIHLYGGFIIETRFTHVFAKYPSSPCAIVEVSIPDNQYEKIQEIINEFIENKENYTYAFLGLALVDTHINKSHPNKFFCSQFVAHVLNKSGIKTVKEPIHIHPIDFIKLENSKIIYEGILQQYIPEYIPEKEEAVVF